MGSAGKILILGSLSIVVGISAMQAIGSSLRTEFASQGATGPTPVAASSQAVVATEPVTARTAAIRGATIYEQAIFDAFPSILPKTRKEKRVAAQAADLIGATINLQGHLCAHPFEVQKAADGLYGIGCIARRDGSGRLNYLMDIRTGEVSEI